MSYRTFSRLISYKFLIFILCFATNAVFSEKWSKYDQSDEQDNLYAFQRDWYLELYGFGTEAALRDFLRLWRADAGLQTNFDEQLGLVLQPALAAYELDRATGVTFGNQDFQAAIKGKVLKGETFKAYPTCFGHADALSITTGTFVCLSFLSLSFSLVSFSFFPLCKSLCPSR